MSRTPLLNRMARIALADYLAGDRSTFVAYTRSLRGPALRRFCAAYYANLTGAR